MRISDWSSEVCSSDLPPVRQGRCLYRQPLPHPAGDLGWQGIGPARRHRADRQLPPERYHAWPDDRKSVVQGQSVSVRVDLGGRSIIKTQKSTIQHNIIQIIEIICTEWYNIMDL